MATPPGSSSQERRPFFFWLRARSALFLEELCSLAAFHEVTLTPCLSSPTSSLFVDDNLKEISLGFLRCYVPCARDRRSIRIRELEA